MSVSTPVLSAMEHVAENFLERMDCGSHVVGDIIDGFSHSIRLGMAIVDSPQDEKAKALQQLNALKQQNREMSEKSKKQFKVVAEKLKSAGRPKCSIFKNSCSKENKAKCARKRIANSFFRSSSKRQFTDSKWKNTESLKNTDQIIELSPVECFIIDDQIINVTCQEELVSSCRNDLKEVDSCTPDFDCDSALGNSKDEDSQSNFSELENKTPESYATTEDLAELDRYIGSIPILFLPNDYDEAMLEKEYFKVRPKVIVKKMEYIEEIGRFYSEV